MAGTLDLACILVEVRLLLREPKLGSLAALECTQARSEGSSVAASLISCADKQQLKSIQRGQAGNSDASPAGLTKGHTKRQRWQRLKPVSAHFEVSGMWPWHVAKQLPAPSRTLGSHLSQPDP